MNITTSTLVTIGPDTPVDAFRSHPEALSLVLTIGRNTEPARVQLYGTPADLRQLCGALLEALPA